MATGADDYDPSRAWSKTSRLDYSPQTDDDRYGLPENFLEIEVCNPVVMGEGRKRYVSYEIIVRVRLMHRLGRSKIARSYTRLAADQHPKL